MGDHKGGMGTKPTIMGIDMSKDNFSRGDLMGTPQKLLLAAS